MVSDQDFGMLREKVDNIERMLDRYDRTIFGNGKEGLYDMTKKQIAQMDIVNDNVLQFIGQLRATSDKLNIVDDKLQDHIIDPRRTFKGYLVEYWKEIFGLLVVVQLFIELLLPQGFTIWSLIEKIF